MFELKGMTFRAKYNDGESLVALKVSGCSTKSNNGQWAQYKYDKVGDRKKAMEAMMFFMQKIEKGDVKPDSLHTFLVA